MGSEEWTQLVRDVVGAVEVKRGRGPVEGRVRVILGDAWPDELPAPRDDEGAPWARGRRSRMRTSPPRSPSPSRQSSRVRRPCSACAIRSEPIETADVRGQALDEGDPLQRGSLAVHLGRADSHARAQLPQ